MMDEKPKAISHRLKSLAIIGGFLDGQTFELADGLNCIIGARGTGKTTILEFVRYALGEMPGDSAESKRIESLVERNLGGGRIQLGIETRDGLSYIISRSVGDEPIVLTEDGKPTDITLRTGGFFRADIYSQNEVESIADRALSQLDLIDNFEAEKIAEIERRIKSAKADLAANASNIVPLDDKKASLDEELGALPSIEEKLKAYKGEGGDDSKGIDKAHELKALRDREKRMVQGGTELLDDVSRELAGLISAKTANTLPSRPTRMPSRVRPLDSSSIGTLNAVMHRDYSHYSGYVAIAVFDDRIEIRSYGRLPNGITVKQLSRSRLQKYRLTPEGERALTPSRRAMSA